MQSRTITWIIIAVVAFFALSAALLAGTIGYFVYQHAHPAPFAIADPAALESTPVTDPTSNFQIRPPLGWIQYTPASSSIRRAWKSPDSDTIGNRIFTPNLNVSTDTYAGDYTAAAIHRHQQSHPDFHLISNRRVMINSCPANIIDYTFTANSGWLVHVQQTIIPTGRIIYLVTATTHAATWEKHRSIIESSLATFQITR